jgi:predicted GNAT family N-acyltransferase
MIKLVVAIKNPETCKHFQNLLPQLVSSRSSVQPCEVVDVEDNQETLIARLKHYFREDRYTMAVLISDWLVPSPTDCEPNTLAKACQAEFGNRAFGTIAIMRNVRRVTDIDRTVGLDCTDRSLEIALGLVIDRLSYLAIPAHPPQVDCNRITVRPLRPANETEFQNYFSLRHRVYTIMGYLVQEVESSTSKLELNEADLHAIHIGAFYRDGAHERLVGTARVVTNREANDGLQKIFESISGDDPTAKQFLATPYALGLPIFHTHKAMTPIIQEVFARNQFCGELSRVIVAPEFRGSGISKKLVGEALRKCISEGAQRLFLECLFIHESLYQKHSFERIVGVVGPVIDVARTMVAMEMRTDAISDIRANLYRVA